MLVLKWRRRRIFEAFGAYGYLLAGASTRLCSCPIHTGLRNEELRLLQWRQIDFLREELTVGKSKTKGGEGRVVPLSPRSNASRIGVGKFPDAVPEHYVFPAEGTACIAAREPSAVR